ncbi:MAG: sterol desaturase family protein [Deltaproteobacteria bacterium]|nr:sterol desaturase family protein [Deltaproteobacteria bacterium]
MTPDVMERLQNPQTIFYWPYIAIAIVMALGWLILAVRYSLKEAWIYLFSREIWLSPTAFTDLQYSLMYLLILRGFVVALETAVFVPTRNITLELAARVVPDSWWIQTSVLIEGVAATLVTMLAIDFSSYWVHRWMHEYPILWRLHSIHHSAEVLTPMTTYRQHLLEPVILNTCRAAASGIALGFFHAIFIDATPVITVFGMGAGFFVYMFTTNLHHCHVPVCYPRILRWLLVSPHQHQLHHSRDPRHFDCNFGVVFSFWDRAFGTLRHESVGVGELVFGIPPSLGSQKLIPNQSPTNTKDALAKTLSAIANPVA